MLMVLHWPAGLLLQTAPRVLALELGRFLVRLGRGRWSLAWVQARAWAGFLRRLPSAARLRGRGLRGPGWTSLLKPPGAIPAIRLPGAGDDA
jgi:hypothetical protein